MKKWTLLFVIILASMLVFAACGDDDDPTIDGDTDGDADGDEPDGDTPDGDEPDGDTPDGDTPDGDEPDGDTPDGDEPETGAIGAACAAGADCASEYCMNATTIGALLDDFQGDITNGYCTVLMCKTDGSDGKCTADMNAVCFSLYPFAPELGSVGICLATCESDDDCRAEDDMACLDPQSFVDAGLMTQADKDSFFGDNKGCLPNDLATAAVGALTPEE